MKKIKFIDLFAGAGGLSEGFIREGFSPVAHVEMDCNASNTLKTRTAFHYLKSIGKQAVYNRYLEGLITREQQWYEKFRCHQLLGIYLEKNLYWSE